MKILQEECLKKKPCDELIQDKMMRTFEHRAAFITSHSVAETLQCFPPLQHTTEVYSFTITANYFVSNLKSLTIHFLVLQFLNEVKRLGITENALRDFLISKRNSISQLAQTRKQKNRSLLQLLTAQAECACTEGKRVGLKFLVINLSKRGYKVV